MGSRVFGHVGDGPGPMLSQKIVPVEIQVPNFDQAQVDYLRRVFPEITLRAPTSMDELVAAGSLASLRDGQLSVINHIQAAIDARKATS